MLSEKQRETLLGIARDSIQHGLQHNTPMDVALEDLDPVLREKRATFVTLELRGDLRGCIGSLEPRAALAADVARNAFLAAFRDPRFTPVTEGESNRLEIHISVLSRPEPMSFKSEQDFVNQLRPGVDGVILEDGRHYGTFLPSVWEDLPEKADFVKHLKMKAGLPPDHWSKTIKAYRYTTEYFP